MPRTQKPSGKTRHDPLHIQLDEDEVQAKYGRLSQPGKRKKSRKSLTEDDENAEVRFTIRLFSILLRLWSGYFRSKDVKADL